jgi:hypothetical protein
MTVPAAAGGPAAAAADEPQWRSVQWYGGAMQAQLPARFTDVSDVRPVPDHQEVCVLLCGGWFVRCAGSRAPSASLGGTTRVLMLLLPMLCCCCRCGVTPTRMSQSS